MNYHGWRPTRGVILLRELQSATGEELRPFFGRTLASSLAKHPKRASGIPSAPQRTAGATIGRGVEQQ